MAGESTIQSEKFIEKNSFGQWKIKMKVLLKKTSNIAPVDSVEYNIYIEVGRLRRVVRINGREGDDDGIVVEAGVIVNDKVANQQAFTETTVVLPSDAVKYSLTGSLEKLNSILLDLYNLDVKIEDEDVVLILLVSLPSSFESRVESFVVDKDSITLEEV
ncbi:uncharacterized protein LOC130813513 [Amaranthus tricolor]|uniref:uncharacterized protein LOC130813513 n=1 Tax=Amaranthus tricolor TaxID=29722 RepID=UPI00258566F5|nr:uncharacterized protein LOC130813513 [Amaranthus tricolor]